MPSLYKENIIYENVKKIICDHACLFRSAFFIISFFGQNKAFAKKSLHFNSKRLFLSHFPNYYHRKHK